MTELVLRVECQGKVLGEFPLDGEAVVLQLRDGDSGQVLTTLTLEPGEPAQASAPAHTSFPGLPPHAAIGDLYQDETVDLVLSNEDTIAKGLARIRGAAKGSPGTINVELPRSQQAAKASEPMSRSAGPELTGPEILEVSELSLPIALGLPAPPDADTVNLNLDPLPAPPPAPTASKPQPIAEPAPEPTQSAAVQPGLALPSPDQDRSVTRTLSNGLVDLIGGGDGQVRQVPVLQPAITRPIPSEESARPTHVDQPAPPDEDQGPPTHVSSEPFLPQPIAPQPPADPAAVAGPEDTRVDGDAQPAAVVADFAVGTDFADDDDEPVTVVAQAPAAVRSRRPLAQGAYDELPVGRDRPGTDDLSLGIPQDPGMVGPVGGYDELPVPPLEQPRRGGDDDLSLSLPYEPGMTDASIAELSLPVPSGSDGFTGAPGDPSLSLSLPIPSDDLYDDDSEDDITLPLPEDSASAEHFEPLGGMEATVTNAFSAMQVDALAAPQSVTPRLMDTTAGFSRDPSTERLEGAEVWFRRGGEWTPRGALNLGQHVQAFGGMVRCDDSGGLVVLAGPRLHGSATMPSGELRQINSGQQAVHLPPGTSVILWQGEQGIYVRSNVAADASGPVLDQGPVVYRRPPRSRSWKPPASDLDES